MYGDFVNGRPLVCGGSTTACSEYSFANRQWTRTSFLLNAQRDFAASAVLPNGTFLVTGGGDDDNSWSTTELLIDDSHFEYGVGLPARLLGHCAVLVNESHLLVAGGLFSFVHHSSYILDLDRGTWSEVDHLIHRRAFHSCGLVSGSGVVVAAGGFRIEIVGGSACVCPIKMLSYTVKDYRVGRKSRLPSDFSRLIARACVVLAGKLR